MQLWTWGPGKKDLQEYKEKSTFPSKGFAAIWLLQLSPPQSWGWWSLQHTFPDTHQTWHMGCSRKPNVCFQMCLLAPAELLPHHTARDPALAAKLSWGTEQISDCPNPDPFSALLLLQFQTTWETCFLLASIMFHSTGCPLSVQTQAFSFCGNHSIGKEKEDPSKHRSHPCTQPDVARTGIWIQIWWALVAPLFRCCSSAARRVIYTQFTEIELFYETLFPFHQ